MSLSPKDALRKRRRQRVSRQLRARGSRPRLIVAITNRQIIAQIVDSNGKTLAYSSSLTTKAKGTLGEQAKTVGSDIGKQANKLKVKQVTFDRHGRRYHGRVETLAASARTAGLEF